MEESGDRYRQAVRDAGHVVLEPSAACSESFEWVVLDHYELGKEWLDEAVTTASKRLVIDDLEDRELPCHVLINANPYATRDAYAPFVRPGTRLLLGTKFTLLRSAFRAIPPSRRFERVRRVLVSLGGATSHGFVGAALAAVQTAIPTADVDVVMGADDRTELAPGPGVSVYRGVDAQAMADLLRRADLGVGAGGMSAWERCQTGLPSISIRVAPNQDRVVASLAEAGATIDGGRPGGGAVRRLTTLLVQLARDPARRQAMSEAGSGIVDGLGTLRAANIVDGIQVRRARREDAKLLFRWANDATTRASSFSSEAVEWATHIRWLDDRLVDPRTLLYIGSTTGGDVGQVRFDLHETPEVSVSVAPEHRGVMLGGLLLEAGLEQLALTVGPSDVMARVKEGNVASRRLFEDAGFEVEDVHSGVVRYRRPVGLAMRPLQ
jgi:spore coat polysaccharide biosynthesis predicted glycosyltransferase SpsG